MSHRTAAVLWDLLPPRPADPIHVIVIGSDRGRRPGIIIHRVEALADSARTAVDGIPITAPSRTLFDLASMLDDRELEQAFAQAIDRRLVRQPELQRLAAGQARRRGMRAVRRMLDAESGPRLTRSEAELRFLALVRKARLPEPQTNMRVGAYEVDFLWPDQAVVVEVDGAACHSSPRRFETDRRRDADLLAQGFRVLRVTWSQIIREPEALVVRLARILWRENGRR